MTGYDYLSMFKKLWAGVFSSASDANSALPICRKRVPHFSKPRMTLISRCRETTRHEIVEPGKDSSTNQAIKEPINQSDDAANRTNVVADVDESKQGSGSRGPVQHDQPPREDEDTHCPEDPTRQCECFHIQFHDPPPLLPGSAFHLL